MERNKKADISTLNQRLDAFLVQSEEEPYVLPENWCWIRQRLVCSLSDGEKRNDLIGQYFEVRYLRGKKEKKLVNSGKYIKKGTRVILVDGENSGEIFTVAEDGYMGSTFKVLKISDSITDEYLLLFITSKKDLYKNNKKGSAIPHLNKELFFSMPVPLPPVSEQERIVRIVKSIFFKLDKAIENIYNVLESFEKRKDIILQKAFSGQLTEKWRKNHNIELKDWKVKTLIDVATLQTGVMKGKHYTGETVQLPYLRVANVQDGFLNLEEIKEIEIEVGKVSRYLLRKGDVLFTEGGDFDKLGRGTVWEEQIPNCLHQNHIFVVRPDEGILNPYFLSYQAGSKYGKDYFLRCSKQTTNLASINSTQLKEFPVKIPPMLEQLEIVALINDLVDIENRAKDVILRAIEHIDIIKKAILHQAFCGQLGTNNPNEESAYSLIIKILSEEDNIKPKRNVAVISKEMHEMPLTAIEALQKFGRLTPEELKGKTKLDIDEFYLQIKELIENSIIIEIRNENKVYLEAVDNANR